MNDPKPNYFYFLVKNMFKLFFKIYNRLEVYGFDKIPHGTQVIVAANHASYVDPPLVGGVYPGCLRFLAKESLFRIPVLGFLLRALGAIPVEREDSQRAGAVMKSLLKLLGNGESVMLFPEGTRTSDGRLKPLEAGVAYLSVKTGVPVLPVYVGGSFKAWPKGKTFPRPSKLSLRVAPPIYPDTALAGERERRDELLRSLETAFFSMEAAGDVR
ncbi:MAG: 1-acyl-sn-glycerol-3-phosphate acyltransferase [Synergistaceae bacterium]|nr:1-acyl-sn-glycerol-3-phosphate acyltransferase [Synergistaceae bacterium]